MAKPRVPAVPGPEFPPEDPMARNRARPGPEFPPEDPMARKRAIPGPEFPPADPARSAVPGPEFPPAEVETAIRKYRILVGNLEYGGLGELIDLPDTGATLALVEAGALAEVAPEPELPPELPAVAETDEDLTAISAAEIEEADNG